jgi:excinuclease ABC subunit A
MKIPQSIRLWGVRQNNLKNISVEIPLGSFTVVCGPSGSGKSSLAFETLYAEGQRRYIESLSNYTKQFLNKAPKPDLDGIENIPPAISIEQKNSVKSSRSSVGTTTEVVDFLRLMFEKIGHAYCPDHHVALAKMSPSSATALVLQHFSGQRGYVLAPIHREEETSKKAALLAEKKLLSLLIQDGILRIFVPKTIKSEKSNKRKKSKIEKTAPAKKDTAKYTGEVIEINAKTKLPEGDFFIVTDRIAFSEDDRGRLHDSLTQAYTQSLKYNMHLAYGRATIVTTEGDRILASEENSCHVCGYRFPEVSSALFSFNSPVGACGDCKGFGNILTVDEAKIVPNPEETLAQGCIRPFAMPSAVKDKRQMMNFCKKYGIDIHTAWKDLPRDHRDLLWKGNDDFWGVLGLFEYLETKKYKMHVRVFLARHKSPFTCPTCKGTRLKKEALEVKINGKNIADLSRYPVNELLEYFKKLKLSPQEKEVCAEPHRQITDRLQFLCDVGAGYLTLDRSTKTLSGGEFQRLNLSNQLGVGLSQTLYVLDEPTIGLHPRDNDRLINVLHQLNQLGNTLVVVEHDQDVIKNANHVIEMGPGSGHLGGTVIFAGEAEDFYKSTNSNTVPYLTEKMATVDRTPRPVDIDVYKYTIDLNGCRGNNLKNISVKIPLNRIVTVTGVSGSGKSTLISDTLYPALARELGVEYIKGLEFDELKGVHHIKNVLFIDQSPIGTTARSNPVTYLKIYDAIRTVMAAGEDAKSAGYSPSTFSLNVDGGRCPVCRGLGYEIIDMMFMDDIEIPCDTCDAKKFRPEVLEIKYKGKNIYEIMNMTVVEAMDFFVNYPNIRRPLSLLREVGLEYITLGQSARTLSGGESQRLKVAREFNSTQQKDTLYILDEPTTGLHFREVHLLMKVLNRLVEAGGSVLLIEHNFDVIRNSDYIIDLGPDAGENGGTIVATGTPTDIANCSESLTGKYLKDL